MVTDGLRALLLEAEGYATQVFEFVSLEQYEQEQDDPRRAPARTAANNAARRNCCGQIDGSSGF